MITANYPGNDLLLCYDSSPNLTNQEGLYVNIEGLHKECFNMLRQHVYGLHFFSCAHP